jgi:hypothetical protein
MPGSSGANVGVSPATLKSLKTQVHTYDSFGRAIVAAALEQAEHDAVSGTQSALTASVQVDFVPSSEHTHLAGDAAGSGEAGTVGDGHYCVYVCFPSGCHYIDITLGSS